jgi:hypothetical protein
MTLGPTLPLRTGKTICLPDVLSMSVTVSDFGAADALMGLSFPGVYA